MTAPVAATDWVRLSSGSRFVNPSAVRGELPETVTVADDGSVTLFGDTYRSAVRLVPGTVLAVRRDVGGYLQARPLVAAQHEAADRRAEAKADDQQRKAERTRVEHANRAFNEQLNVPVRWLPEANPYASTDWHGSGRGGHGSVYHVRLVDDLDAGRLQRRAGDFLCAGANRAKWGDLFSITDRHHHDTHSIRVTCRACLAITERWAASAADEDQQ